HPGQRQRRPVGQVRRSRCGPPGHAAARREDLPDLEDQVEPEAHLGGGREHLRVLLPAVPAGVRGEGEEEPGGDPAPGRLPGQVRNTMTPTPPTRRFPRRPALLAGGCLLTVAAAVLLAHEGHAPLPTRGAQVDVARGYLYLSADARDAIDVQTAVVEQRTVAEKLLAYATLVPPWTHHGFATTRLPGRVTKVLVAPGQEVRAGEVLAEVESLELETLQLDILTARNDVRIGEKLVAELTKLSDAVWVTRHYVREAEAKLVQGRNDRAV